MPFVSGLVLLAASLSTPARSETWPAGATIEQAALADITPEGFEAIAALIPELVPESLPIDDIGDESEGEWGQCWLGGYAYSINGMWVGIEVVGASIVPADGVLEVRADLMVWINDASDPFDLYAELECIGDTCSSYIDPFLVTVTTSMGLAVVTGDTGEPVLDATVSGLGVTYDLQGEDIHLDDCAIGTIEDVLNFFGISLYDLVIDQLGGVLDGAVADLAPTLESTIEDAFGAATINQEIDVNGAIVALNLFPSSVVITPAGVRVQLSGSMSGDAAECVAAFDPGGSLKTPSSPPDIGVSPNGVPSPFHVGITMSDDFTNEALYALWRGGLLCYSLEPGGAFPLDTSILGLLTGDVFAELFPSAQPVVLRTAPRAPPTADFAGEHDINLNLNDLSLEFYAELDGRLARIVAIDLNGHAGADLGFDGTTGELAVAVAINPEDITPSVYWNEFYPAANDAIVAGFSGAFGGLLDTVVGGLISDLAFALPSFNGIGLQDLEASPAGASSDWLGLYAWIGGVTYASSGEGCGGCGGESSSCSGGCTVGGTSLPSPLFFGIGALLMLRRRRGA